jgi:hypothetical protein
MNAILTYLEARLSEGSTKAGLSALFTALAAYVMAPNDASAVQHVMSAVMMLGMGLIFTPTSGGK